MGYFARLQWRKRRGQRAAMTDGSENDSASGSNEETIDKEGNSDNSIVALPCEICGELCPSDRLMENQEG